MTGEEGCSPHNCRLCQIVSDQEQLRLLVTPLSGDISQVVGKFEKLNSVSVHANLMCG